jgi:hypothetical protein
LPTAALLGGSAVGLLLCRANRALSRGANRHKSGQVSRVYYCLEMGVP